MRRRALPRPKPRRGRSASTHAFTPALPVGPHPAPRGGAERGRDPCYLAGLGRYGGAGEPHRPFKLLYALAYREDPVKPTFVVDISDTFDIKMRAIRCYASQFDGATTAGEIFPTGQSLYELIRTQAAHYGSLIRKPYGQPLDRKNTPL